MTFSFSSVQIDRFKREAKKFAREHSIPHSRALDNIAIQQGFKNWSLLIKRNGVSPVYKVLSPVPRMSAFSIQDRHYLHGDQYEDDPTLFYCARCDVFAESEHFDEPYQHQGETHGERYLVSLDRWNRRSPESKNRLRRPADALNLLADIAMTERLAFETARAPFHRWLLKQVDRNDPVGDLAVDVRRDKTFPIEADDRRKLEQYLARHGDHVVQALNAAWLEFSTNLSTA